jgi:hypothetical protein
MFGKEWRELCKYGLFLTASAVLIPAFIVLARIAPGLTFGDAFFPLLQVGLFFWAFIMGSSFLMSERFQNSEIYLLSLPYSRHKLLLYKALPRIAGVLLFFVLYVIAYVNWGQNLVALPSFTFTLIYFALFIISFSLSLSSENFLVLFFTSLFGLLVFLGLMVLIIWSAIQLKGYVFYKSGIRGFFTGELDALQVRLIPIAALFLLLPTAAAFVPAFRRLDARPVSVYNRRYFKLLFSFLLAGSMTSLLVTYLATEAGTTSYFLTEDHKLIKMHNLSKVKVYDGERRHTLNGPPLYFRPLFEIEGCVYVRTFRGIECIDLSDYSRRSVYTLLPGRRFGRPIHYYRKTLVFITKKLNYSDRRLELVDLASGRTSSIPLERWADLETCREWIFAADTGEKGRFFLISTWETAEKYSVWRIWDSGLVEKVAESLRYPVYVNKMLLTSSESEIIFHREVEEGYVPFRRVLNEDDYVLFFFYYNHGALSMPVLKDLYGLRRVRQEGWRVERSAARLDLEEYRMESVDGMKSVPLYVGPEEYFYVEEDLDRDSEHLSLKFYRLNRGELTLLHDFGEVPLEGGRRSVDYDFSPHGLIWREGNKVQVFTYPELNELRFKGLN